MRRTILPFGLALVLAATPALAQPTDSAQPRVDVGFTVAAGLMPHDEGERLLRPRVGVTLTDRFALESEVDFRADYFQPGHLDLYYTVQGRYRLNPHPGRWSTSFTFGGLGLFSRHRRNEYRFVLPNGTERVFPERTDIEMSAPIVPTVGVAVQYVVAPRLAVRVDTRTSICPFFDEIGIMPSVGFTVPIGAGYRR